MPKAKKVKHELFKTRIWVEFCGDCGYIHAPEFQMELWTSESRKHHKPAWPRPKKAVAA